MTMTIRLTDLQFFSYHGLYAEEQVLGNEFVVNLTVRYPAGTDRMRHIDQTVNYEQLFRLVEQHMQRPTPLLETIVSNVVADLKATFPMLSGGNMRVLKRRPPVQGWLGDVEVGLEW
ncbi:MAG: dihydroneopterin aldolase [Chitinophagaceae bacterium]|nr:dihydroneopterin aldolase [Chitinophagaceae bacterium]